MTLLTISGACITILLGIIAYFLKSVHTEQKSFNTNVQSHIVETIAHKAAITTKVDRMDDDLHEVKTTVREHGQKINQLEKRA